MPIFISYDNPSLMMDVARQVGSYKAQQDSINNGFKQQQLGMEQQRINNQNDQFYANQDYRYDALGQQWDAGERAHQWSVDQAATAYKNQQARDATQHGYRMDEIYGRGQNAQGVAGTRAAATTQAAQTRADASRDVAYLKRIGVNPDAADAAEQRRQETQARLNHASIQQGLLNQMKVLARRDDFYDPQSPARQQHDQLFQQYQQNEKAWQDFLSGRSSARAAPTTQPTAVNGAVPNAGAFGATRASVNGMPGYVLNVTDRDESGNPTEYLVAVETPKGVRVMRVDADQVEVAGQSGQQPVQPPPPAGLPGSGTQTGVRLPPGVTPIVGQQAGPGEMATTQPGQPARISSAEEYAGLPSGALYVSPDGQLRRKK